MRTIDRLIYFLAGLVFIIMLALIAFPVFAGRYVTNNYYETTEVTEVSNISITAGIDADELAKGLTAVAAAGAHNFDFSTLSWQASVQASVILDTSADAVSFGIGKRFESMDVLWSGTFTRFDDNDLITFGGSWRF